MRGGAFGNDFLSGTFFIFVGLYSSSIDWDRGAALSYKCQNRSDQKYSIRGGHSLNGSACGTFYICLHAVTSIIDWSFGAVIYYKCQNRSGYNFYPRRGGYCSTSFYCGVLCIYFVDTSSSIGGWIGAALNQNRSDKCYSVRGGRSGHGSYCGVFSINLTRDISDINWALGAALSYKFIKIEVQPQNILCTVVTVVMVFIVVFFMSIRILLHIFITGLMVLL